MPQLVGHASRVERAFLCGCLFLCGASALTFEIVWTRRFVVLFGNSSHAISTVLTAFMAGLGIGAFIGGKLADRYPRRLLAFSVARACIGLWALAIPPAMGLLLERAPHSALLVPGFSLGSMTGRFCVALGFMLIPCMLMGASLPLVVRYCTDSVRAVGHRTGSIYGWETLGASLGCAATGYWMVDTLGLLRSNGLAAAANMAIAACVLPLAMVREGRPGTKGASALAEARGSEDTSLREATADSGGRWRYLLLVAFVSGAAGLSCEVLWVRYLAFFSNVAYTFAAILCVYLLGLGAGGVLYRLVLAGVSGKVRLLATVELLLGLSVAASFIVSGLAFSAWGPGSVPLALKAVLLSAVPTLLMGVAFPLLCATCATRVSDTGRTVGSVYLAGAAGSVAGSLLPVFVLIPTFGIQNSLLLSALVYCLAGVAVLLLAGRPRLAGVLGAASAAACCAAALALSARGGLCQRAFLASSFGVGRQSEIVYYTDGSTATVVLTRDRINGVKHLFINGVGQVDVTYSGMSCFKLLGAIGPLLHPNPERVLAIAIGGGVAAGAIAQFPEVKTLVAVDLERSIVEAATLLSEENDHLFQNPKLSVVIDDGRNYLLASDANWSVIVCDSTHPKSSDSWVLYTREFYSLAKARLAADGVLVQWLPLHDLSVSEFKILVRTFQAVFPHAGLWFSHGINEAGQYVGYTLLVGTSEPLRIDVPAVARKLAHSAVASGLGQWDLSRPEEILENFLCGESALKSWLGQGPINTDDLPYTQYQTAYSSGRPCTMQVLSALLESVVPYLVEPDNESDAARRRAEDLLRRLDANRLAFIGLLDEAHAYMPDHRRLRRSWENSLRFADYLTRVGELYADSPRALAYWADVARSRAAGSEIAVALYQRAVALSPDDPYLQTNLGFALAEQGRPAEAMDAYQRALSLSPRLPSAHNNLGLLLLNERRYDVAAEHFRQAAEGDPTDPKALVNLGLALAGQGDLHGAIGAYRHAVRLDREFLPAYHNLGVALTSLGQLEEAEKAFRLALEAGPESAQSHTALAKVLLRLGRPEEAARHAREPRKLRPAAPYPVEGSAAPEPTVPAASAP